MLFEKFRINNVTFADRILRSSMGGRTSCYDGTVSPARVHFENRFGNAGVAGISSPTISVNEMRQSPLLNQVLAWCSPNAPFSVKDGSKPDSPGDAAEVAR